MIEHGFCRPDRKRIELWRWLWTAPTLDNHWGEKFEFSVLFILQWEVWENSRKKDFLLPLTLQNPVHFSGREGFKRIQERLYAESENPEKNMNAMRGILVGTLLFWKQCQWRERSKQTVQKGVNSVHVFAVSLYNVKKSLSCLILSFYLHFQSFRSMFFFASKGTLSFLCGHSFWNHIFKIPPQTMSFNFISGEFRAENYEFCTDFRPQDVACGGLLTTAVFTSHFAASVLLAIPRIRNLRI